MSDHREGPRPAAPPQRQLSERDSIPLLQSLATSIFVPITEDLTAGPFVPPASAVARLEATIASLDAHAELVRSNMRDLVRRECVRILRELVAAEARVDNANAGGSRSGEEHHPPGDMAAMIANMQAPHDPGRDYNNIDIPMPDFSRVQPATMRGEANRDLMASVSRALSDLRGYDAHVAGKRALYEQALKREVESQQAQ